MNYTIERITQSNYSKFEDMVFFRENGFQREPSSEPISEQIIKQLTYPDFYVYAVEVENRFVGWISITYIPKIGSRWNGKGHIYVDDCKEEADGAREQDFTSFLIDRTGKSKNEWCITCLTDLIDFVEPR